MPEMSWMPYLYISFAICPVINSTYIYLRDRGSYIYICTGGEYTKNPLEKYNNRKVNTYLIPAQTHYGSTTLSLER
jgi:hypothetical protein